MSNPGSAVDRLVARQQRLEAKLRHCGIAYSRRRKIIAALLAATAPQLRTELAGLFAEFLGEPDADALSLASQWIYYRSVARAGWLGGRSDIGAEFDRSRTRVLDEGALGTFLSGSRGVLIASIHMGDYLQGLAALANCLQTRRVIILRKRDASPGENSAFSAFSRAGIRFDILRHDRRAAFTAVRALRNGSVMVVLYDLSHRWGRTAKAKLFGRDVEMVCGPVDLAMKTGADVLPIVTGFDDSGCLEVRAGRVLQTEEGAEREILHQQLAEFAEQAIRARPAQWHHWPLLPEMLGRGMSRQPRAFRGARAHG